MKEKNKKSGFTFILAILLIISIVGCIFLYAMYNNQKEDYNNLKEKYDRIYNKEKSTTYKSIKVFATNVSYKLVSIDGEVYIIDGIYETDELFSKLLQDEGSITFKDNIYEDRYGYIVKTDLNIDSISNVYFANDFEASDLVYIMFIIQKDGSVKRYGGVDGNLTVQNSKEFENNKVEEILTYECTEYVPGEFRLVCKAAESKIRLQDNTVKTITIK